ncbi:glutathione S-transferase [Crenothrix sp.]|uniref:glutathione S-transferase n=1 Tax=Crenothrix sp. TaxID=3100433 RepID=UPI00374D1B13
MTNDLPVLYSFRRCPYAIRARLAIAYSKVAVEIREVDLKHKPEQMLVISPKGTVPVLHLPNGKVLEESLHIMCWALLQHDPDNWQILDAESESLIQWNDGEFKYYLDRYKYADRYPEYSEDYYRKQAEIFLAELEVRLSHSKYLAGSHFSLVDAAIFPFIRQLASVNSQWFEASDYKRLNQWLTELVTSDLFASVMIKQSV